MIIDKEINRTILKIMTQPAAKDKFLESLGWRLRAGAIIETGRPQISIQTATSWFNCAGWQKANIVTCSVKKPLKNKSK